MSTFVFTGCGDPCANGHEFYYNAEEGVARCIHHEDVTSPLTFRFNESKAYASVSGIAEGYTGEIEIPSAVSKTKDGDVYPVKRIEFAALKGSGITKVTIGTRLELIMANAFQDCTSLTSIAFRSTQKESPKLEEIESYAFANTGLASVTLPASVKNVGNYAFENCAALTSVSMAEGFEDVGSYAFVGCSALTSVAFPASTTGIGAHAFEGCDKLASVTFASGCKVTEIRDSSFAGCTALTSITLPNATTRVLTSAFEGCTSLANVKLGNATVTIGDSAFRNCTSIESVFIPDTLTLLGSYSFYGCTSLKTIQFDGRDNTWRNNLAGVDETTQAANWNSEDHVVTIACSNKDLQYTGVICTKK